jgi:hypothetical protein
MVRRVSISVNRLRVQPVSAHQLCICVLAGLCIYPLALVAAGCGGSPSAPNRLLATSLNTPTTPTLPGSVATAVVISGNNQLTTLGERSQLTAMASYANGTTRDVTSEAVWTSNTPSRITASGGAVMTVDFGVAFVSARVQTVTGVLPVTATYPGTTVFWGRVREPGLGGMPNVRVLEMRSGQSQTTDADGVFQFPNLTVARFRLDKAGYETAEVDATPPGARLTTASLTEPALQRMVRINAGDAVRYFLAPHDVSYPLTGGPCSPCKLIRITTPTAGTMHLDATWAGPQGLHLWVDGTRFAPEGGRVQADASVTAGEVVVHLGYVAADFDTFVDFTMATTLRIP